MKFKSNTVVIHSDSLDGYASAWCLKEKGKDDFQFVKWKESDDLNKIFFKKCTIYFLDIVPPVKLYHKLRENNNNRVFIVDNKEKNREVYGIVANDPDITIDGNLSCCEIMWSLLTKETYPTGLTYIADYVMGRTRMSDMRDTILYLNKTNLSLENIREFVDKMSYDAGHEDIKKEGQIIKTHYDCLVNNILQEQYRRDFLGHEVPFLNTCEVLAPILASKLCKNEPFSFVWFINKEGHQKVILKSDKDGEDVSKIAKEYNGYGHCHSAGFTIKRKDFFII